MAFSICLNRLGEPSSGKEAVADAALVHERDALRTILQDKVLTMVGEVGRSVDELGDGAPAHPKLVRQLDYLRKLVSATVSGC